MHIKWFNIFGFQGCGLIKGTLQTEAFKIIALSNEIILFHVCEVW